ncbi:MULTISPECIES: DUF6980 family protein [Streptomyces]|uniref:DUF6980 domain-containing protein n=1 Tax=Streptomyces doudnae TaxID=3075536 RepID=A0ABD5ENX1_9ACTN|nr:MULTISPECIES: hypothetical protein [unclassified Streptomyces]MDT0435429.1 hypothetical protein [Streptomyces sp. DSM 41981]MYQ62361.1 hypothetical protein [Streptomyces sp. SID4950]SCD35952.1 hypothetical protein GA0115242_103914 [Streptomyces sp. SolWspMP-5a-2]
MTTHCCEAMNHRADVRCDEHDDPFACPDALIDYSAESQEYGLIIHDGGTSSITVDFCPWCGRSLSPRGRVQDSA